MSKILIIEDESTILEDIAEVLSLEGFDVITAVNGIEGVERARKHIPDLILCDVMMPKLDGYGVLQHLQGESSTRLIPFIFLTALSSKGNMRQGMEMGADDYITKPFTNAELLSAVHTRLQKQSDVSTVYEERIDALRNALLTTIPHELRTPLTGILGAGELLMADADILTPDDIREMADLLLKAGKRLHRLIENYLIYSRLKNLKDHQEHQLFQFHNQLSQTQNIKRIALEVAKEAEREDDLVVKNNVDTMVRIQMEYLHKILEELLDNAFKFSTPKSKVVVSTNVVNNHLRLDIFDAGRGMSKEQIKQIGVLVQFDRARYEQQGSGMGLVIVKYLVEIHHGKLMIDSTPDNGTRITVELPLITS